MMRVFLALCLVFILASCQPDLSPYSIGIESVRESYAPDKRVAIWEVEAVAGDPVILRGKTHSKEAKTALLLQLDEQGLSYTDSVEVLTPRSAVVSLSVCNIRSNPKHSAELATQCTMGQKLTVYEEQEGWFRVQTPDQYLGWLDAGGLHLLSDEQETMWQNAHNQHQVFLPEFGFAFSEADSNSPPISDLIKGNLFLKLGEVDAFTKIELPNGKQGYVPANQVRPYHEWWEEQEAQRSAEAILSEAKNLLGRPYLWGGTSGKGMDCSGFTKEVYFRNGMILPRDASQQVHAGTEIETDPNTWANLEAGDLLFFGRKATPEKKERITHVAIYMGDGQIIHSAGAVKIESLIPGEPDYAPERVGSFVRAKRML